MERNDLLDKQLADAVAVADEAIQLHEFVLECYHEGSGYSVALAKAANTNFCKHYSVNLPPLPLHGLAEEGVGSTLKSWGSALANFIEKMVKGIARFIEEIFGNDNNSEGAKAKRATLRANLKKAIPELKKFESDPLTVKVKATADQTWATWKGVMTDFKDMNTHIEPMLDAYVGGMDPLQSFIEKSGDTIQPAEIDALLLKTVSSPSVVNKVMAWANAGKLKTMVRPGPGFDGIAFKLGTTKVKVGTGSKEIYKLAIAKPPTAKAAKKMADKGKESVEVNVKVGDLIIICESLLASLDVIVSIDATVKTIVASNAKLNETSAKIVKAASGNVAESSVFTITQVLIGNIAAVHNSVGKIYFVTKKLTSTMASIGKGMGKMEGNGAKIGAIISGLSKDASGKVEKSDKDDKEKEDKEAADAKKEAKK
jgi:hypothetical protein